MYFLRKNILLEGKRGGHIIFTFFPSISQILLSTGINRKNKEISLRNHSQKQMGTKRIRSERRGSDSHHARREILQLFKKYSLEKKMTNLKLIESGF